MNNLLISDQLTNELFNEPSVVSLYRTEVLVPDAIIFFKRTIASASTSNVSTLKLLGRSLKAVSLSLGYLQILRPPPTVQALKAIAILKNSCLVSANIFLAYSRIPNNPGALTVQITDQSYQALLRIERYDPAFSHIEVVSSPLGNIAHVEGDGVSADDIRKGTALIGGVETPLPNGIILRNDIIQDADLLVKGITFPVGVLLA